MKNQGVLSYQHSMCTTSNKMTTKPNTNQCINLILLYLTKQNKIFFFELIKKCLCHKILKQYNLWKYHVMKSLIDTIQCFTIWNERHVDVFNCLKGQGTVSLEKKSLRFVEQRIFIPRSSCFEIS